MNKYIKKFKMIPIFFIVLCVDYEELPVNVSFINYVHPRMCIRRNASFT